MYSYICLCVCVCIVLYMNSCSLLILPFIYVTTHPDMDIPCFFMFYLLFGFNLEYLLLLIPPNHDIMKFNKI